MIIIRKLDKMYYCISFNLLAYLSNNSKSNFLARSLTYSSVINSYYIWSEKIRLMNTFAFENSYPYIKAFILLSEFNKGKQSVYKGIKLPITLLHVTQLANKFITWQLTFFSGILDFFYFLFGLLKKLIFP